MPKHCQIKQDYYRQVWLYIICGRWISRNIVTTHIEMRSSTSAKHKRGAGYISKGLVYILWGAFWGELKGTNPWWAGPKSGQFFTVLGQVVTGGIRATLVSALSMWVRVQLSLGESRWGGATLSAESRRISCGGANLSEDVYRQIIFRPTSQIPLEYSHLHGSKFSESGGIWPVPW